MLHQDSARPIILIRFSLISESTLSNSFPSIEELASYLYGEARLSYRLWLFENICLPALLNQTDPNFDLVILTSAELPQWCFKKLEALIAPLNAKILFGSNPNRSLAMQEAIRENFDFVDGQMITMRIDDDDAIAIDWVEKVNKISRNCKTLLDENDQYAIYPSTGMILDYQSPDQPLVPVFCKMPYGIGLTLVTNEKVDKTIYSYSHFRVPKRCPTLAVPAPFSFLYVFHNANISYLRSGVKTKMNMDILDNSADESLNALSDRFRIDLSVLDEMPNYVDPFIVPRSG